MRAHDPRHNPTQPTTDVPSLGRAIDAAVAAGITTVDLSDVYCHYRDGYGHANDRFAAVLRARVREGGGVPACLPACLRWW